MSSRKETNPKVDKKVFKRTAIKTRKVNVKPTSMRGGTRMWGFMSEFDKMILNVLLDYYCPNVDCKIYNFKKRGIKKWN